MGLEDAPIGLEIGNWSASEADVADASENTPVEE